MDRFLNNFIRKNLAAITIWFVSLFAMPIFRIYFGFNYRIYVLGTDTDISSLSLLVSISASVYLAYRLMYHYLNRENDEQRLREPTIEFSEGYNDKRYQASFENLEARLETLGAYVSNSLKEAIARTANQPTELFKSEAEIKEFKTSLAANIVLSVTSNLKTEIVAELDSASKFKSADRYQSEIRQRLYRVVRGLERRANLNLSVGATIGAVGIGVLIYLLYFSPPTLIGNPPDYTLLGFQYFSRTTIVLLIEVFAFFFLKLYSQTLGELRYIHNEITNIEMKSAGLQTAIASGNQDSVAKAIESTVNTERNFILDKGKTTVDLERHRHESNDAHWALGTIKDILTIKSEGTRPPAKKK